MTTPVIREVQDSDVAWILALSALNEVETSPLDGAKLRLMLADAFHARVVDGGAGYIIPFDETAIYDSANYHWFRDRYARFVYIDRVVIADHARGKGLARAFYEDLFAAARRAGHKLAACEVNLDPPNPASDAFHSSFGFVEAGRATLASGKTVRYLTRDLP